MFKYAFKRVIRSYRLFIALTLGVLIATTFFASMLMAADIQSQKALTLALDDVDYDARMVATDTTWNLTQYDEIEQLVEDMPEVSSLDRYTKFSFKYNASAGQSFDVYGLEETSTVWTSMSFLNGSATLQENETLVVASSVNASLFSIGQIVTVPITYFTSDSPLPQSINLNLTVAGFCDVSEQTAQLLNPQQTLNLGFIEIPIGNWREYDLMLVNWDETVEPILDWYLQKENTTALVAATGYLVQLDRAYLINPYDIGASSSNIQDALSKIEDRTAIYNARTTNLVGTTLTMLSFASTILILAYVSLAAPVIFMSWYSSTMLSDVSYNLRRREFGLLQTKGFGPKSIKSMLRLEGFFIGIIGGTVGLIAGTYIAHVIGDVAIESAFTSILANPINMIFTIGFGVVLSYWSIRGPSDRASKLDPLDALKQYIYVEEQREYKRLLPLIAFALGSYKLIVWILGVDMNVLLGQALSTNFVLLIVVALWTPVDLFLNFAGPIAFLYGSTKILLRGSQRFQIAVVQTGKRFFGQFGNLATRNVKRNPSRNAALVFVVALIVAYGIFSVGSLSSEQDMRLRTDQYNVGSDVNAIFAVGENTTDYIPSLANIEGVESTTTEYQISFSTTRGSLAARAIDPESWLETAFYEDIWFSEPSIEDVMSGFTGEKIILPITISRQLELGVGNMVTLLMPSGPSYQMEIVSLIGYASPLEAIVGQFAGEFAFGGNYPAYIPFDFLNDTGFLDYAEPHVLMKTAQGTNGTLVEHEILQLFPSAASTDSATTRATERAASTFEMGATRARWLGISFAIVLAIIGTGLIVSLTLKEKEYETALLSVRGFTNSQVLKVLVAEIMVMTLFSLVLGIGTGFIWLFGDTSNQSQNVQALVRPQMVFDPLTIGLMCLIVLAIVVSAILPILRTSRFDEKKIHVLRE